MKTALVFVSLLVLCTSAPTDKGKKETTTMMKYIFTNSDRDSDGFVSRAELKTLFSAYDMNWDGKLEAREFIVRGGPVFRLDPGQSSAFFKVLDANRNDVIDDADLNNAFSKLDLNNDNQVSEAEFSGVFIATLWRLPFVQLLIAADTDLDGAAHISAYKVVMAGFDTNSDGMIDAQELSRVFGGNVNTARGYIAVLDTNKDGQVSVEGEVVNILKSLDTNNDGNVSYTEMEGITKYIPQL